MQKDFLLELKKLLTNGGDKAGEIEMTFGNYTHEGVLIKDEIPTLTTDLCEIGVYEDVLYCTYICDTNFYTRKFFDLIVNEPNVAIYGLKNFHETWYPSDGFDSVVFETKLKSESYMQIEFNFSVTKMKPMDIYKKYLKIREVFSKSGMKVVDQLEQDMTIENKA